MTATSNPKQLMRIARRAINEEDYVTATQALVGLVEDAHQRGDKSDEARHLSNLSLLYNRLGLSEKSLEHMNYALVLVRELHDRTTEEGLLGNMGNILRELKQYDQAIRCLNQALVIAQEIGDVRGRGIWLGNLGLVYDDLGDYDSAIELHKQSVKVAQTMHDQKGLAQRLVSLGNSYMNLDFPLNAIDPYYEAITIYRQLGDKSNLILRLSMVAGLLVRIAKNTRPERRQEHLQLALEHLEEAYQLTEKTGDEIARASLLRSVAGIYHLMGKTTDAVDTYRHVIELFHALNMPTQAQQSEKELEELRA